MKAFNKLVVILVCLLGTVSLASCINGDDNFGLDPAVESSYRTSISGSYVGSTGGNWQLENKIYFYNDTIDGETVAEIINGWYIINNVAEDGAALIVAGEVTFPSLTYGGTTHNDIRIEFLQSLAAFGYISGHKAVELPMYVGSVYEGENKLFEIYDGQSYGIEQAKAQLLVRVTR